MVKRKAPNKSAYYDDDKCIKRAGKQRLAFKSSEERVSHQKRLKAERDRRYKAKLKQENGRRF